MSSARRRDHYPCFPQPRRRKGARLPSPASPAILSAMSETILLEAGADDRAEILPFGAEMLSWRARGVELVWAKDQKVWDRTAPVLFPVVGWTRDGRARVDGRDYPLSLHGFAWTKRFDIAERREDFLRLALVDDAETRAHYPFAFHFEAEFKLSPGALDNALIVTNTGERPLPYACGLHPAFRWPLAGSPAEHAIVFEKEESGEVPVIAPGGLFSRRPRPVPLDGRRMPLRPELFAREALCFMNARSRSLVYDNGAGARLAVELDGFPHIAFWTLPPAPYLCVEPWTGHGDPEDFFGDLCEKPSMRILAPGESARHGARFALELDAVMRA